MSIEIVTKKGQPEILVTCDRIIDPEGEGRRCNQPVQLKDFSLWGDEETRRRWDIEDYCPACKLALSLGELSQAQMTPEEQAVAEYAEAEEADPAASEIEDYHRIVIERKEQLGEGAYIHT